MDISRIDHDLMSLINAKMALAKLDYSDENYDDMEEELHDLEDDFMDKYGTFLEDALHEVHDEMCPDSDVLLPIAYIPNKVIETPEGFDVPPGEGVFVDVDDYSNPDTKLVILPNPTRIVLIVGKDKKEILWSTM